MDPRPTLSSEYTPNVDLWMERSNLVGLIIAGVAYGILFTIFIQCILALHTNNGHRKTQARWLTGYSCIIFLLATFGFAGNTRFIQMTYIDYRNFPGGPNDFTLAFYTEFCNIFSITSYVIMNWFADGLMFYRFAVIYDRKLPLMIIPGILYAGIVGLSLAMLTFTMKPEEGFFGPTTIKIGTAYWSLSIGMNIIITSAIAGRLLKMRANIRKVLGPNHSSPYTSVLSMIVESAALYTSWAILFLVPFARQDTFQNIVLPSLGQVQGIAPLLIIFRVAQGKAWNSSTATNTLNAKTSTAMQFDSRRPGWSQRSHGTESYGLTNTVTGTNNSAVHLDVKMERSTLHTVDSERQAPGKAAAL
ncbi:hypothetical protein EST38_g7901 [Candolleomyces aberdarensis]|uniref:Uncharacterized protein n=1 Tax=Candolleomyces aberdarensis TaxID=2316362 RepID=A0A4V1Q3B0_9AGAR|nr:hypothetical protein EST38_g7901 [Candolleomyces aberdarensis]